MKTFLLTEEWQHWQRKSIKISVQFPANMFLSCTRTHTPLAHIHGVTPSPCSTRQPRNFGCRTEPAAFWLPRSQKNLQANRPQGDEQHPPGALHPFPFHMLSFMPFTCTLQPMSSYSIYTWNKPLAWLRKTQGSISPFLLPPVSFPLILKPWAYQQPPNTFKYSICRSQAWYNSGKSLPC